MSKVRIDEDICPLSEFRAGVASFVKQIQETRRPMVLTQRGRGVAVLVDVHEYESMQERLEVLESGSANPSTQKGDLQECRHSRTNC